VQKGTSTYSVQRARWTMRAISLGARGGILAGGRKASKREKLGTKKRALSYKKTAEVKFSHLLNHRRNLSPRVDPLERGRERGGETILLSSASKPLKKTMHSQDR